MIVFVLLQSVPPLLALLLAGMIYLAIIEVREQDYMDTQVKVWWVLLVVLTNLVGLIALRIYTFMHRRKHPA